MASARGGGQVLGVGRDGARGPRGGVDGDVGGGGFLRRDGWLGSDTAATGGPDERGDVMGATIGGIAVIVVWLAGAVVWGVMSIMSTAMANDAGTIAPELHARMLILLVIGEVLVAIAGVALGLSIPWDAKHDLLMTMFWWLLGVGVAAQVFAIGRLMLKLA